jgi:hypothetical protein
MRPEIAAALLGLASITEAATLPLRPAVDKLAPWTTVMRDRQPEDAFAVMYKVGNKHLVFVGAKHANRTDSQTFKLIEGTYEHIRFDAVIAEGFPTARGPNPARTLQYVQESGPRPDGFVEAGELFPTVIGAQKQAAKLWGGEAHDLAVKARLFAKHISGEDLLGFYVLRNIPQWIREQKIADAGDRRLVPLVEAALARDRTALQLPKTTLADFDDWSAWYRRLNGKPISKDFITEETGPLADGRFGSNRVAFAISRERAAYLHELILEHLNGGESVLVVFGASHLMIHRPALDSVLGEPCYSGADMALAASNCR